MHISSFKAPFPYIGGKSEVTDIVWPRLGADVTNLVEPFFGSGAILLNRPGWNPDVNWIETVNDISGFVCIAPNTRVLTSDLRWVRAGDIAAGDAIMGFDEFNGDAREGLRAPKRYRHWQHAKVVSVAKIMKPSYRLTFDDGTQVVASGDHQWLGGSHKTGGRGWRWVTTKNMICNRETQRSWVLKLAPVVGREDSYDAGWLSGFYDGEGNIKIGSGSSIALTQEVGPEIDRAEKLLKERGFEVRRFLSHKTNPNHSDMVCLNANGGMREMLRFLMLLRPERLLRTFSDKLPGMSLYGRKHHAVGLVSKEYLGTQEVVAIATTSRTFIAEGLASHNCNFWRSVQAEPDQVAHWADNPINENDLHARHAWLVQYAAEVDLPGRLEGDPDYYDPKIAGYWLWGACCWIGSGWCSGRGPWQRVETPDGWRVQKAGNAGMGINRKRVHLGNAGRGINRKRVHLGGSAGANGVGIHSNAVYSNGENAGLGEQGIYAWMNALSERLRRVRVCCGDWERVCGPSPTFKNGVTGIFLDPPYSESVGRDMDLYEIDLGHERNKEKDTKSVNQRVYEWCGANENNKLLRIALCGYRGEYDLPGWECVSWKAHGGFGNQSNGRGRENAEREMIWFSPHCLTPKVKIQAGLFDQQDAPVYADWDDPGDE